MWHYGSTDYIIDRASSFIECDRSTTNQWFISPVHLGKSPLKAFRKKGGPIKQGLGG